MWAFVSSSHVHCSGIKNMNKLSSIFMGFFFLVERRSPFYQQSMHGSISSKWKCYGSILKHILCNMQLCKVCNPNLFTQILYTQICKNLNVCMFLLTILKSHLATDASFDFKNCHELLALLSFSAQEKIRQGLWRWYSARTFHKLPLLQCMFHISL